MGEECLTKKLADLIGGGKGFRRAIVQVTGQSQYPRQGGKGEERLRHFVNSFTAKYAFRGGSLFFMKVGSQQ